MPDNLEKKGPADRSKVNVNEPCWTPPGEIAMSFKESPKAPDPAAAAASNDEKMKGTYRPNRNDRPTAGAVHAATY